jgi:hypothetical protein
LYKNLTCLSARLVISALFYLNKSYKWMLSLCISNFTENLMTLWIMVRHKCRIQFELYFQLIWFFLLIFLSNHKLSSTTSGCYWAVVMIILRNTWFLWFSLTQSSYVIVVKNLCRATARKSLCSCCTNKNDIFEMSEKARFFH